MHEVDLMQSTLQTVARVAEQNNLGRLSCIGLRVGVLSGVVPEALQFAFEVLRSGTVAADAKLQIEIVPARFWCENCQVEFELAQFEFECARCGGPMVLRGGGTALELAFVEGENTVAQHNPANAGQFGKSSGPAAGRLT